MLILPITDKLSEIKKSLKKGIQEPDKSADRTRKWIFGMLFLCKFQFKSRCDDSYYEIYFYMFQTPAARQECLTDNFHCLINWRYYFPSFNE